MGKKDEEEMDIVEVLLDENNKELIYLSNGAGGYGAFQQLAIVPHNDKLYAILNCVGAGDEKDLHEDNGKEIEFDVDGEPELYFFYIDYNTQGEGVLVIEENEEVIQQLLEDYDELQMAQSIIDNGGKLPS